MLKDASDIKKNLQRQHLFKKYFMIHDILFILQHEDNRSIWKAYYNIIIIYF